MAWLVIVILVGGCASMSQAPHEALVRDPGSRTYNPPVAVAEPAKSLSDYAVLSENAYIGEWKKQRAVEEPRAQVLELPAVTPEAYSRSCVPDPEPRSLSRPWAA